MNEEDGMIEQEERAYRRHNTDKVLAQREDAQYQQMIEDEMLMDEARMTDESRDQVEAMIRERINAKRAEQKAFEEGFKTVRNEREPEKKKPAEKKAEQKTVKKAPVADVAKKRIHQPAPENVFKQKADKENESIPETVTIKKGDTLWDISKKYGINVNAIREMNDDVDPRRLKIGSVIRLRAPSETKKESNEERRSNPEMTRRIRESMSRRPSAMDVMREVDVNNPYNKGIKDAIDTGKNYFSAAATVGSSAIAPKVGPAAVSKLSKLFKQKPRKSVIHDTNRVADEMFRQKPVVRPPRGKFHE